MTKFSAGDEVRIRISPDSVGTITETGLEMQVSKPDRSVSIITEGVLFRPAGSDESHLMHQDSFEHDI